MPTLPSFVDPAEKDWRASLREGRDIILSLVVSWNMIPAVLRFPPPLLGLSPNPGCDPCSQHWSLAPVTTG